MKSSLGIRADRAASAVSHLLAGLLLAAGAASCRSTAQLVAAQNADTDSPPAQVLPVVETAPHWITLPLSTEKLKEIEGWLATQPPDSRGYWIIEGELQLSAGRLELARREPGKSKTISAAVQSRLRAAKAGLQRVVADPEASEGQKQRAQEALLRAEKAARSAPNAALGVPVIARAAWGAAPAHPERMDKNNGGWKRITVHHSAEAEAPRLDGSVADSAAEIRLMQKSHMESKTPRWGDIGYHFLIDPFGHVFQGRELAYQGAHADGDNNIQNIGVCLIGNFDEERPTKLALESLRKLLDNLRSTNKISSPMVFGHSDLKSTHCPGRFLEPWVKMYARS